MARQCSRDEDELDLSARQWLSDTHQRVTGVRGDDDVSFRSWTPVSARTTRRRRFTALQSGGRTLLVSKSAYDEDDHKVAGEWNKLSRISLPPRLDHTRAVARTDHGFVMAYVPGVDLPDVLVASGDARKFATLLGRTIDLLAGMHLHAAVPTSDARMQWSVAEQYVPEPADARSALIAAVENALVGPTHGDLAPWNVRYDEATDRITLIDWEDYRPIGISGIDVINLLVTFGLVVFPEYRERGFEWLYGQVLEGDHWYAILLRRLVMRYAALVGTSPRLVIDLLPFFCQWLIARISSDGRDPAPLYYGYFLTRYVESAPQWVAELPR
jgi:hypothetical protein